MWDVVIDVLRSSNSTKTPTNPEAGNYSRDHTSKPIRKENRDDYQFSHVDYVTTNANSSQGVSQLYIFEDNKTVIKMIIHGRSPTMRHVSRTHKVALDWLFNRIILDYKIQIKNVDTINQLAEILPKVADEWNHLLKLLNIKNFSMLSFSHFLSNEKHSVMSKREHDRTSKEGLAVTKRRPMSLVARSLLSSKIQIDFVDTIKQLADMLTNGSYTRDEWDRLLRLLNIMDYSMFSCSHSVLSYIKQSAMSKRAQESTSKEGSAIAKPRPMKLVSRNLLSAKKDPPQDVSDSNSPENLELDQSCVPCCGRKLTRNTNPNPTMYSQERQQEDTQSSSANWSGEMNFRAQSAPGNWSEVKTSKSRRSKMELHNMQISDNRYFEKVFENLRQKLNLVEVAPVICIEALKTNVLMWRLFTLTTMKAAIHLGPNCMENLEVYSLSTIHDGSAWPCADLSEGTRHDARVTIWNGSSKTCSSAI